ncbi:hypothetical protein pEaSNUABM11_00130 [Erwinia phage pEa_SNUABM_11]|nr:hypothetical protein pEaSNUABM11_00130 [Erwinia phage pEa_SNUABM_11]
MTKPFVTYDEMQAAVEILSTMVSTDHKRRLVFYRARQTNRSVRTIRTATVNLVTDVVTPLHASFQMSGPTNDPLVAMAKWKGFRHALSKFFFTCIARKPALLELACDRDIESLVSELPELGYLLEFNKYLKRACFTNISAEDMESRDGWPTSFAWSITARYEHSVRSLMVDRTLKWSSVRSGDRIPYILLEATVRKHGVTVKDNGKIQHLSFALTYPVAEWPKVKELMIDPQVEPLIDQWLCPKVIIQPTRAG